MKIVDEVLSCRDCGKFPIQIERMEERDEVTLEIKCIRCKSRYSIKLNMRDFERLKLIMKR